MLSNRLLWDAAAMLVGAAFYLLCHWLFNIRNFLPLILLLLVILGIGVQSFFYVLFVYSFLLLPLIVFSYLGASNLCATTQGKVNMVKCFIALLTFLLMECVWLGTILYIDDFNKRLRGSLSSIYKLPDIIFLLMIPTVTAYLIYWRLRATRSMPE
jgi:hypothetical protein